MLHGFELWIPPTPDTFKDGITPLYEIIGTDAQIVQFPLKAGRSLMCFSGAMAYMSNDVKVSVQAAGFKKTFGRLAGGGSLFQCTYTNASDKLDGYIACTPDYPGVIIPIDMRTAPSGKILAMRDSFLCSTIDLAGNMADVGAGFNPANSVGAFCCSGIDFIVQSVENGEYAFLMAMGTVITKTLGPGEALMVDTDSILCFEQSVQIDIEWVGNWTAICCGGEGLFNTKMTGPGKIWLQSLSIDKLRNLFPVETSKGSSSGDHDGNDGGDWGGDD